MKKNVVVFFCLAVLIPAVASAQLAVSFTNSTCSIVDFRTVRLNNVYVPGFGYFWADFIWDPYTATLVPIFAAAEGAGGGNTNVPPQIYNLTVPSVVYANTYFCINYSYTDGNGLADVREHHILMSDGTHAVYTARGSGNFSLCSFYFTSTGARWVEAYVTDSANNASNAIRASMTVVSSGATGGHCYVDSVTLDVCCDYYGTGYYICQSSNTCGQPGGICINSTGEEETDKRF